MNSLFMGKKTIKWLLYNLEEVVSDVNPKQFATIREDDIYIYIYNIGFKLHRPMFFYLDVNFHKSITGLHYLHIFFMLTKFKDDQRSIAMLSINCLNLSFCSLK